MNQDLEKGLERKVLVGLIFTVAMILLVGVYFLTESSRQRAAEAQFTKRAMREGAHLFLNYCSLCHGQQGQGVIAPPLAGRKLEDARVIKLVTRGGVVMPAFGEAEGGALTMYQVRDIATFVVNWDAEVLAEEKHLLEAQGAVLPTPIPPPPPPPPAATAPPAPPLQRGPVVFIGQGCGVCHTIKTLPGAGGKLGPELSQIGSVAATRKPNFSAEEYIRESLLDPNAFVVPGFPAQTMPPLKLTKEDVDALVAYMLSLK